MKFRKLPVVVDAFEFGSDPKPWWFEDMVASGDIEIKGGYSGGGSLRALIRTLEGVMQANNGDYIIRGVNGEIYPCKPGIFLKTYERVEE